MIKPMLACDADETKLSYPVYVQPKVDGVRGVNFEGLRARSLKPHKNIYTTNGFSQSHLEGLDGELVCGDPRGSDTCRKTTSALNTIEGEPVVDHWVFDIIVGQTIRLPYHKRYEMLQQYLAYIKHRYSDEFTQRVRIMPNVIVNSRRQLEEFESKALDYGYEGIILRDPMSLYKQGRSTVRESGLLRIKRFSEDEAIVTSIVEGQQNLNEASTNALGNIERSTHMHNMRRNGMVGTIVATDLKTGMQVDISPGRLTHEERVLYFRNQNLIIGKIVKYKHFARGIKDKRRFPTFQSFRSTEDI